MFEGYMVYSPQGKPLLGTLSETKEIAKFKAEQLVSGAVKFETFYKNYSVKQVKVTHG